MTKIKDNSRYYSHPLRKDFDKFGERKDFTQTLLFASAVKIDRDMRPLAFRLNDQISQFQVSVSMFSADGSFGFSKSKIISNKNVYASLTTPITMVRGDVVNIPISVTNNMRESKQIQIVVEESPRNERNSFTTNMNRFKLGMTSLTTMSFLLDTNKYKNEETSVSIRVKIYADGVLEDAVLSIS